MYYRYMFSQLTLLTLWQSKVYILNGSAILFADHDIYSQKQSFHLRTDSSSVSKWKLPNSVSYGLLAR